MQYLIKVTCSK